MLSLVLCWDKCSLFVIKGSLLLRSLVLISLAILGYSTQHMLLFTNHTLIISINKQDVMELGYVYCTRMDLDN